MNKEELINKANEVLNNTKKAQEEYHEERITIFKLLENPTEFNLEILESIIKIYEKNEKNKLKKWN